MLYHLRLQPSEVEILPYYEYEYIVKNLIDILKEKQEAEENQMNGDENSQLTKTMNNAKSMLPSNLSNPGSSMPKIPSMPSIANFPGIPSSLKI